MIKKEIFIGFLIGLVATCAGVFLYCTFFLEPELLESLRIAQANDRLGSVIALGAILNFLIRTVVSCRFLQFYDQ